MKKGLRIGFCGKGGVGKTTIAGGLARLLSRDGARVLAVDIDPSPNLAAVLGIPEEKRRGITPLSEMLDLIEERTGVRPGTSYGSIFRINPKVDDLLERYGVPAADSVSLLVLGTITTGGSGCFCPENALLKRLLRYLILNRDEILIMDMEAGVEHLGRATGESLDVLVVVVEPSIRSIETAERIRNLASDLRIPRIVAVLNKSRNSQDRDFAVERLKDLGIPLVGWVPYDPHIVQADLQDTSIIDHEECGDVVEALESIKERILSETVDV